MRFLNLRANVIEDVTNPTFIKQYEARPEVYQKLDGDGEMSYKDLKAKATEMGLEFAGNIKKDELEKLIADNDN